MSSAYSVSLREMGWVVGEDELSAKKYFPFKDFKDAFAFMTAIAAEAERLGHHPDWRNVYGDVWVTLTTHDVGGLTQLDLLLAQVCDARSAYLLEEE